MSDLTKRLVALANSLGGTEEADIMEGVAEIERLQAERDDWRDTAEDGAKMMRAEIERLRVCMAGEGERLTKSNRELRDENKRLRAEIARLDIFIVNLIILAREHGIDEKKIRKIEREQSGRKDETGEKPQSDQR